MRISTLMHGILDFATAATVMVLPRRLGASPALTTLLTAKAMGTLGYSLMTRYELGLVKLLPMRTHLLLDGVVAASMFALPFVFRREAAPVRAALVGIGLLEALTTLSTEREPGNLDLIPETSSAFVDRLQDMAEEPRRRISEVASV